MSLRGCVVLEPGVRARGGCRWPRACGVSLVSLACCQTYQMWRALKVLGMGLAYSQEGEGEKSCKKQKNIQQESQEEKKCYAL